MANDKSTARQYPVQVDISQQGAGHPVMAPSRAYRAASAVGRVAGDVGAAAMNRNPFVIMGEGAKAVYNSPTTRSAVEGLFGLTPGALAAAPTAAAKIPTAADFTKERAAAVAENALAVGRNAPTALTPQQQVDSYISKVLEGGATNRQVANLVPLLGAPPKPISAKDRRSNTAGDVAETLFKASLAAAEKLPEGEDRDKVRNDAAEKYFSRFATLAGANVQPLTMQDLIDQQGQ